MRTEEFRNCSPVNDGVPRFGKRSSGALLANLIWLTPPLPLYTCTTPLCFLNLWHGIYVLSTKASMFNFVVKSAILICCFSGNGLALNCLDSLSVFNKHATRSQQHMMGRALRAPVVEVALSSSALKYREHITIQAGKLILTELL